MSDENTEARNFGALHANGGEVSGMTLEEARRWVESEADKGYIFDVVRYLPDGSMDYHWEDDRPDALEASVQSPAAVDRERIIEAVWNAYRAPKYPYSEARADMPLTHHQFDEAREAADAIIASGILQDAAVLEREAEARGLENLIERVTDDGLVQLFGGEKFVSVGLLVSEARAQQVREGRL